MKPGGRRLVSLTAACSAALGLAMACAADVTNDVNTAGAGGSSLGGQGGGTGGSASGGTGKSGAGPGGTSTGGTSTGGTSSAGTGGKGGGGASANGGTAGIGQAGEMGTAGDIGAGGAPPFVPTPITLVNPGFETGPDNLTAPGWPTVPPCVGTCVSYASYTGGVPHAGGGHLALYSGAAYVVSTSQTVSGLANGTYELAAWATAGVANQLYLFAIGYDNANPTAQLKTDIAPSATYVQYKVSNIPVTSNTLTIGVYIDAMAAQYANLDDFTLTRVE